jgi:hypothetical protein
VIPILEGIVARRLQCKGKLENSPNFFSPDLLLNTCVSILLKKDESETYYYCSRHRNLCQLLKTFKQCVGSDYRESSENKKMRIEEGKRNIILGIAASLRRDHREAD